MTSNRSAAITASFGGAAPSYDRHADLQRHIADRLAALLPGLTAPSVLELGCGTGLLTRHLLDRYPGGSFLVTDLSEAMLRQCRSTIGEDPRVRYAIMDASEPTERGPFDLIATSMTLHWLPDPNATLTKLLRLLKPRGVLLYATLGQESFAEWRHALTALGLANGTVELPALPGLVDQERLKPDAGTLAFLRRMKAVGGLTPRAGYRPLSAGALRRALRMNDARSAGRVTWHIVYGRLDG